MKSHKEFVVNSIENDFHVLFVWFLISVINFMLKNLKLFLKVTSYGIVSFFLMYIVEI